MRSNNALEQTVMHRGRPVLAMNCALTEAEDGPWPAAELDR